jgi:hypothetical protein
VLLNQIGVYLTIQNTCKMWKLLYEDAIKRSDYPSLDGKLSVADVQGHGVTPPE